MTHVHSGIRASTLLACVSLVSLLTACGPSYGKHYDANNTNIPYNNVDSQTQYTREHSYDRVDNSDYDDNYSPHYTHRGYYDYNGNYMARNDGLTVPQDMFPPRGMCRVWFTDRPASDQPSVESCNGIKSRVPAGAYVIYGG